MLDIRCTLIVSRTKSRCFAWPQHNTEAKHCDTRGEGRKTASLTFILLLFASLTALAGSDAATIKNVTFAYNTPTLSGTLPIVVAQDFGFFRAEGLEVRTVFIRGGPTAMAALVGGGVDYTFVAGVAAVRAIAQNAPMIIVSGMQPYMDYTMIGAKGMSSVNVSEAKSSESPVPAVSRSSRR